MVKLYYKGTFTYIFHLHKSDTTFLGRVSEIMQFLKGNTYKGEDNNR